MTIMKRILFSKQKFIGVCTLFVFFLSTSVFGQLGISGPTSVNINSSATYYPTYNGSSTYAYNGSYTYVISGGVVTGTSNTSKSGTCTSILYSIGINVTWTSSTGTLSLYCGLGSKTITISAVTALQPGTLLPINQTINFGATPSAITGTAATGGAASPNYQYQWWSSPDGSNWSVISGANQLNYSPGALYATTFFRRQVTETTTSTVAYTYTVYVAVYAQVTCSISPLSQTIVSGTTGSTLTATANGGNGAFSYQWQISTDNSNWSNTGTNASTYSPGVLTATRFYRVVATSNGASATSATATISVCASATTVGSVTGPDTCMNGSTIQLFNNIAGGTWSSSNAGLASVDANGVVNGRTEGVVTITYTLTNSCGTASAQKIISIISFTTFSQSLGTGIPDPVVTDTISLVNGNSKTTEFRQDTLYSSAHLIRNVIALRVKEETTKYIPGDFTATAVLKVEYGHSSSDISQVDSVKLAVSYTKNGGNKYNALNYFTFKNAEFTRVTFLRLDTTSTFVGSGFDIKQVLLLTNSLAGTRYYKLADNKKPVLSYTNPGSTPVPDALPVNWVLPAHTQNNGVQLEWTWIENEMAGSYLTGGVLDTSLVFKNGATRIDLPVAAPAGGYDIPLLYDGVGKLFMRVRAINNMPSGSRSDGPWSGIQTFTFSGHNDSLNWQSTTTFAEEGKRKSVIQYYDGSLRGRQTVTKDNVSGKTVVAETFFDGEGRPAIQVLPAPGISTIISYTKNLNKFNNQGDGTDPAEFFDFTTPTLGNYSTPQLSEASGTARYYSSQNPDVSTRFNKNIPVANGFAYAVTRYTPDGTGRILRQGGVGDSLQIGGNHATKYFYGTAAQEELDALFGTEVGNYTHYFKNMVSDANGQMSVSYTDMSGHTIATALAGNAPTGLQALNTTDTANYKNQAGKILTRNLLDKGSNILKGNSIESINTILVPVQTQHTFSYQLTKQTLQLPKCGGGTLSYGCKFDLQISVTDESGDASPIQYNYSGIDTINFQQSLLLPAGSYSVRKTLTINQDSLDKFMQQYNTVGVGLCQTQQYLIDSIAALDSTASGCGITTDPLTSGSCLTSLGNYSTYLYNYAISIGDTSVSQLTTAQLTEIRERYISDSSFCASLNDNTSQTLANTRSQMLLDMIPYSGQYARDTGTTAMYYKYNIFSTSGSPSYTQPFYKYPKLTPSGSPDNYYNVYGSIDNTVSLSSLQSMSMGDFEERFKESWASSLIAYHPEYGKLKFAEDSLRASYNFIDSIELVSTAFNPYVSDPYFNIASRAAEKDSIIKYSNIGWPAMNNYSIWQISYGDAIGCKVYPDADRRNTCYANMPKVLTSTGTVINTQVSGLGSVTLTSDMQLSAWKMYKALYGQVREDMVNRFINVRPGKIDTADNRNLVNQGFMLHFPYNNTQLAQNLGWGNWYPGAGGSGYNMNDSLALYSSHCDSYINAWRLALLNCPQLAAKDSTSKEQILNSITSKMAQVCKYGTNGSNPYGSSTVAPAYSGVTFTSFEQVVNHVLDSALISKNTLYCNPYGIEWPKPYGKNPLFTYQMITAIDTCTCSQFYTIRNAAITAGYNGYTLSSLNQYLWNTYQDTITTTLYQSLLNCGQPYLTNCRSVDTTCQGKSGPYACTITVCDTINTLPLLIPQPLPAFLVCGFSNTQFGCYNCSSFKSLDSTFYTLFNHHPVFTGSITADSTIAWNDLFARYVNFKTGLQHNWQYYTAKFNSFSCGIGGLSGVGTGLSICLDKKALSDTFGFIPPVTPCQRVKVQSSIKAAQIFEINRKKGLADFKTAYLAKCVSSIELFKVSDTLKEYHYTLYYYDLAGNLIKTVPPKGVNPIYRQTWIDSVEAAKLTGAQLVPQHNLVTRYSYNSLNQVTIQKTPDGGISRYYYDRLGRLALSQNAKQYALSNVYSYTLYDSLGRISQVGQISGGTVMTDAISKNVTNLQTWFSNAASTRNQITTTIYDTAYAPITGVAVSQKNLRNRVSYSQVYNFGVDTLAASATYYSYDIHGNVDTLVQDFGSSKGIRNAMNSLDSGVASGDRFKRIVYNYDLISGKVNQVSYQPGGWDAYYQRYVYDGENRLTDVFSGRDSVMLFLFPEREAHYSYYKHGPLARTELGQLSVQRQDFAYTLQGWIKGVNPAMGGTLANGTDTTESYPTAQDVYGYSLNYYKADYKAIGFTPQATSVLGALGANAAPLYNGNISAMAVNIPKLGTPKLYNYHYDQLNRIVSMDAYNGLNPNAGTFTPVSLNEYQERISYDPNGNILTYVRHGDAARVSMDSLKYFYSSNTNRLHKVSDFAPDAAQGVYANYNDLKQNQADNNYQYDQIGNMVKDVKDSISNVSWTVYGKIQWIAKSNGDTIRYVYDATGNRIIKKTPTDTTFYVRDGSGNVLSVYSRHVAEILQQSENHIYGSSRIGIVIAKSTTDTSFVLSNGFSSGQSIKFTRSEKVFELNNHLGNVLVTMSDRRQQISAGGINVDYYLSDVVSANDYYPGGMEMPGRKFSSSSLYRYGFNGKENDNDIKGEGNQQDYGLRIYDPRLVKFLSVDPLTGNYPELTPYQFASNRPIDGIDLDGKEWAQTTEDTKVNETTITRITTLYIRVKVINNSTTKNIADFENAFKKGIEEGYKLNGTYTEDGKTINHSVTATVIFDHTAEPPIEANKGKKYASLIFEDRVSKPDPQNPGDRITTPGETENPFINGFTIRLAVSMDGNKILPKEVRETAKHEAGHSAELNHPWELSVGEIEIMPILNQLDPKTLDKRTIKNNFMNSYENTNDTYRSTSGTTVLFEQVRFMIQQIKRKAQYTPQQLQSDDPEKTRNEDFEKAQKQN